MKLTALLIGSTALIAPTMAQYDSYDFDFSGLAKREARGPRGGWGQGHHHGQRDIEDDEIFSLYARDAEAGGHGRPSGRPHHKREAEARPPRGGWGQGHHHGRRDVEDDEVFSLYARDAEAGGHGRSGRPHHKRDAEARPPRGGWGQGHRHGQRDVEDDEFALFARDAEAEAGRPHWGQGQGHGGHNRRDAEAEAEAWGGWGRGGQGQGRRHREQPSEKREADAFDWLFVEL